MGLVIGKGIGIGFGSAGRYWERHLFGQKDLNFWIKGRSGLTMSDTIGANHVSILTPTFKGDGTAYYDNTINTGGWQNVCDGNSYTIYKKILQPANKVTGTEWIFKLGNDSTNRRGISLVVIGNSLYFTYADGVNQIQRIIITDVDVTLKPAGLVEIFIEVDKILNKVRCKIYKSDNTTIGTSVDIDISSYVTGDNGASPLYILYKSFVGADFKKFLGLKTLAQCRDNSYVTDLQFYYPEMLSGTDVSGNGHHMTMHNIVDSNRYYSNISSYCLDNGYTIHQEVGSRDVIVPNDINGNAINRSGILYYGGDNYHNNIEILGSLTNHNLVDSILVIPLWDRSDIIKFNDICRASSYYDTANPTRWHISELNEITLISYINSNYQGEIFVKISDNSFDARFLLKELFSYTSNKIGSDLLKIYQYTGDYEIPDILVLDTPYTNIVKLTAIQDSEFKFNLNNSIIYSKADVYSKIDSLLKLNVNEPKITTIFRWIQANVDINLPLTNILSVSGSAIHAFNSYASGECGSLAVMVYNIINHYFPNQSFIASLPAHVTNYTNDTYMDVGYQFMIYDGYYTPATIDEIKNDVKLVSEALRQTGVSSRYVNSVWNEIKVYQNNPTYQITSPYDNLLMKLPATATFVYPFKSANTPKNYLGNNIYYGSGLATIPASKVGSVSMPFSLTQITGSGSVLVDGLTYNLPADEAALKAVLQSYAKFYSSFDIVTNTGGIAAEYLINPRRMLLWKYNRTLLTIISGTISVEKDTTATPIPIFNLSINKKLADSWTIDHDENKKMSGIFKLPIPASSNYFTTTFNKSGTKIPIPIKFANVTQNSLSVVSAGVPVIDQCFASILTPKSDSFSNSIELTFTAVDGSDVYYTVDGNTPTVASTKYTEPFTISSTTTIKWINIKDDYANSHVNSRTLTKN